MTTMNCVGLRAAATFVNIPQGTNKHVRKEEGTPDAAAVPNPSTSGAQSLTRESQATTTCKSDSIKKYSRGTRTPVHVHHHLHQVPAPLSRVLSNIFAVRAVF